ncbi:MAG: hypothetical protein F4058_05405 [Rhodothermaceae bacterium]|nr:hypothetical protein [Rhodothermaceae bacterium]MYF63244.1 hypothetical protein [Rhodothermaceae bacterium]MYI84758.1 hypothetical protein [Rhodothermaceae bacterium]
MKRITSICSAIALLAAFFVTAGVSAQIEFEGDENGLRVNGKTIDPSNLPEGLADMLADKVFSLHWGGPSPLMVTINGVQYEVSEDKIVESDKTDIVSFEIVVDPGTIRIGSLRPDRPDRPALNNLERMLVRLEGSIDSLNLIPRGEVLLEVNREAARLLEERAQLTQSQAEAVADHVFSVQRLDMVSPSELSNYMSYVLDASDEMSELLRYEWREEFEARRMAAEINNMSPGGERDEAIAELREKLTTIFHLKQDNRTREIRRMRLDLEKMQLQVEERNRNMERLIDMRLDELLGMGW